ncbi:MAG TPA: porin family protein [Desulfobulbus sp.]|nr:porin family protein [Desulfobulbus sp.]
MKKLILTAAALAIVSFPLTTMAANGVYLKANAGVGMAMDTDIDNMPNAAGTAKMTFDTGFVGTAAIGYDFANPFRVEGEYLWQKNDLDRISYNNTYGNFNQGDLKTQAVMINGYYDVDTGSAWTPFVGAGIGWAKLDLSAAPQLDISDNDDVFAYQFMGGVAYAINSQWSLDVQYRFFGTNDATIKGADFNFKSNDLMVGLRYNF